MSVWSAGRYHTYIAHIQEIGRSLGYDVDKDTMRIPSTKNICLVGTVPGVGALRQEKEDEQKPHGKKTERASVGAKKAAARRPAAVSSGAAEEAAAAAILC